jgi:hypothetical protein
MLIMESMNSAAHISVSDPARRAWKPKARRGRPRSSKNGAHSNGHASGEPHLAAAGSLTRTKALLLAALRVWELKHRIGE